MNWHITEAARLDEMSSMRRSLRVTRDPDYDIRVSIDVDGMPVSDDEGNDAVVEFCSPAGGGGRSPHTLRALHNLYEAMLLDNEEDSSGVPPFPLYLADEMKKLSVSGPVLFYDRRFYCFSNLSSFAVRWRKRLWMTSEHAYQAAKFTDSQIVNMIFCARSAHDAKEIAHKYKGMMRPDWDDIKLDIMEEICRAKLEQHEFIEKRLRQSGDREIVEDSPDDAFWGWGPDRKGLNHLGRIWMKLRAELPPLVEVI